jgi:co-chaperonin GroES (HSP10)
MTVKAVLHRVIVQPVELEVYDEVDAKLKELGLIKGITEETKYHRSQIDQGYVLDVGPTAYLDYVKKYDLPVPVRKGMLVTYARHSGKHVKSGEGDNEVVILNDEDVLALHTEDSNLSV